MPLARKASIPVAFKQMDEDGNAIPVAIQARGNDVKVWARPAGARVFLFVGAISRDGSKKKVDMSWRLDSGARNSMRLGNVILDRSLAFASRTSAIANCGALRNCGDAEPNRRRRSRVKRSKSASTAVDMAVREVRSGRMDARQAYNKHAKGLKKVFSASELSEFKQILREMEGNPYWGTGAEMRDREKALRGRKRSRRAARPLHPLEREEMSRKRASKAYDRRVERYVDQARRMGLRTEDDYADWLRGSGIPRKLWREIKAMGLARTRKIKSKSTRRTPARDASGRFLSKRSSKRSSTKRSTKRSSTKRRRTPGRDAYGRFLSSKSSTRKPRKSATSWTRKSRRGTRGPKRRTLGRDSKGRFVKSGAKRSSRKRRSYR